MRLRLFPQSVTARLTVLCVSSLGIGMASLTALYSESMRDDLTRLMSDQLLTIASTVAQDIDQDIVERRETLEGLAAALPRAALSDGAALDAWLTPHFVDSRLFPLGIFVITPEGHVLGEAARPERTKILEGSVAAFQDVWRGQFVLGPPRVGAVSRVAELSFAVPVHEASGEVRAVLVGMTPLRGNGLLDRLSRTSVGKTGGLVLASPRDRLFIGMSDTDLSLMPTPPEGLHRQHDAAMRGFRGVGIDRRGGVVEELAAVVSVPSADWFLVARIPTEELFAPVEQFLTASLKIALAMFLTLGIGVVVVLRHMLHPLRHVAAEADQMSRGERAFDSLPVRRDDEVGHLTAAFNRVLATLMASRTALAHMAHHDPLTDLPNRASFNDRLAQEVARGRRHGGTFAILYGDLDGFKPINDIHGHRVGDLVLQRVAQRLRTVVRQEDTVARLGGDEFALLLGDLGREEAQAIASKCQTAISAPIPHEETVLLIGLSIGIACFPDDGEDEETLLGHADQEMYRAKRQAGSGGILSPRAGVQGAAAP